jgi:hypothetical protein
MPRHVAYSVRETAVEAIITVFFRWWSTRLPNHRPDSAVRVR